MTTTAAPSTPAPTTRRLRHYGVDTGPGAEFVDLVAAPVAAGLRRGERVVAYLDHDLEHGLRDKLGAAADPITVLRPDAVFAGEAQVVAHRNAAQLAELCARGPVTMLAHYLPWMDPYPLALRECFVNLALPEAPLTLFCGCAPTGPEQSRVFRATHPHRWTRAGARPDPGYRHPREVLAEHPAPAAEPLGDPEQALEFGPGQLRTVRRFVAHHARAHGLGGYEADNLAAAINELTTNSVEHGAGAGWVRIWRRPTDLVIEVCDRGRLDHGRLPGLHRPPPDTPERGRGLWLARELTDQLQLWHQQGETVARATVHHPRPTGRLR